MRRIQNLLGMNNLFQVLEIGRYVLRSIVLGSKGRTGIEGVEV